MSKKEEFMTTLATDEFADDNDDGISLTVYIIHIFIENLYSPKIHGRYRQDTDMYKRQKQNNNTQYTLLHGSG